MARDTLTGTRIRERRTIAGLRQADLARAVGISASYLNLIEHNRRRIGGKLLMAISGALGVEATLLTEGAEAAQIAALREAAVDMPDVAAEADRAEEFAGRFPGWAEVLTRTHRRVLSLEATVETLSDRLTHDPHLAASLHEVLSTAAAIRSSASILAENPNLEAEWQDRFHRNINEDSLRLAQSSKALVEYLDDSANSDDRTSAPQEEVETFVAEQRNHFSGLEAGTATPDEIVAAEPRLTTAAARDIGRRVLRQYARDARLIPLERLREVLSDTGIDPVAIAQRFDTDLPTALRRLAALPDEDLAAPLGLIVADASGSLIFRKQVEGFAVPRFGSSCPLWPVFAALGRPNVPLRRVITQEGRGRAMFTAFAVAHPIMAPDFDNDPLYHATMLLVPTQTDDNAEGARVQSVGTTCRVCPVARCAARREVSVLGEEF